MIFSRKKVLVIMLEEEKQEKKEVGRRVKMRRGKIKRCRKKIEIFTLKRKKNE